MANSISLNSMIGRLHDSAIEHVSKSAKSWFKFGTLRGAGGVFIQNTAISYNGADKPSTFVGGNGPFKIIASKGTFTTTKMFIKLVSEYMKWFAGEGDFTLSEDAVKNAKGEKSGKRFFTFDYTIDYKTGIERKVPPTSAEGKGNDGKGNEGEGTEGKGNDGKGNEGEGTEGKGNDGKGNEGEGTEGKGKEGEDTTKNTNPAKNYGANIGDDTELIIASQIAQTKKTQINESSVEDFIINIKNGNTLDADINLRNIIKNKISSKFNNI